MKSKYKRRKINLIDLIINIIIFYCFFIFLTGLLGIVLSYLSEFGYIGSILTADKINIGPDCCEKFTRNRYLKDIMFGGGIGLGLSVIYYGIKKLYKSPLINAK